MINLDYFLTSQDYLFHGSGEKISLLEPRQAFTTVDGVRTEDGPPAVFASHFIDYAIFMALINMHTCPQGFKSRCEFLNGDLIFGATKHTMDQLHPRTVGYVHVLELSEFSQRSPSEWVSYSPVKPVAIVEARRQHFTRTIDLIEA